MNGRRSSKKRFRSRHETLIGLTGRGGTPHIVGMSLKDTITFALSRRARPLDPQMPNEG
jgi:hypothetical protein